MEHVKTQPEQGGARRSRSAAQSARQTAQDRPARSRQRHHPRAAIRMRLAHASPRPAAAADRLCPLQNVEVRRNGGYAGKPVDWVKETTGCALEIVKASEGRTRIRGSSPRMTSGLYSGRLPTAHRAISLHDSAWSIPSLAMNRCVPRSTVAGFPANGGFLTAALRPHPFSLAIPTLTAASALDWDLDGCGMRFRISSIHWRQCGLLAYGAASFWSSGAPIMERPLPRANLFSNSSQKAPRSQPFTGEG